MSPQDIDGLPLQSCGAQDPTRAAPEAPPSAAPGSTTTTCIETIGGDPETAIRLSFQIKVF